MHTSTKFTFQRLLAGALLGLAVTSSHAAELTWSPAQNISGDSDVSTAGTLVGAFAVGDTGVPAATVNGVTFQGFEVPFGSTSASAGGGNFSLSVNSGTQTFLVFPNGLFGSSSSPFTTLSAGYQTLLSSATTTAQPTTFDLTMSGLSVGETYEFQWWANTSGPATASTLHSAATGTSNVTISDNTSGLEGGLGQFATGTFLADGTSQTITFGPVPPTGPASSAQLNAFQLRQIPEPASLALLGLAVVQLGLRHRCRRRH